MALSRKIQHLYSGLRLPRRSSFPAALLTADTLRQLACQCELSIASGGATTGGMRTEAARMPRRALIRQWQRHWRRAHMRQLACQGELSIASGSTTSQWRRAHCGGLHAIVTTFLPPTAALLAAGALRQLADEHDGHGGRKGEHHPGCERPVPATSATRV